MLVQREHRRDGAALLVRAQRAEVVREALGEHGDRAVGEIDRRAALERLGVEGAADGNVVRHVRDVDADPEGAAGQLLRLDRVVEVARGLAVDGHDRAAREVRAELPLVLPHVAARGLGLGDDRLGILPRDAPLAGHDLDVDARVALEPDQLEHLGEGEPAVVGVRDDASFDEHAGRRLQVLAVGHRQARVDLAVERNDERALGRAGDLPDDGLAAPHEDLHDDAGRARARSASAALRAGPSAAFGPSMRTRTTSPSSALPRAVTGDVGDSRLAGEQEGPALAADREHAGLEVRELDARELLALDAHDLAPPLEVGHRGAERGGGRLVGRGAEDSRLKIGERQDPRPAGLKRVENRFFQFNAVHSAWK